MLLRTKFIYTDIMTAISIRLHFHRHSFVKLIIKKIEKVDKKYCQKQKRQAGREKKEIQDRN